MALISYNTTDGAIEETIDFAGDDPIDVYQVELTGGIDYVASVLGQSNAGGTLEDPYIEIYDSENNLIASADDSRLFGSDPLLQFEALGSGVYNVVVGGIGESSGSYTFDLDQNQEPSSLIGTPPEEWGAFDLG
jgi:hypothetical protein